MAEISDIVRVTAQLGSSGLARDEFGRVLFVYPEEDITTAIGSITKAMLDNRMPLVESVQVFSNQTGVAAAYDSDEIPYDAGAIYFQQDPFPRNLLVGTWYESGAAAYIYGGEIGTTSGLSSPELSLSGNTLTVGDLSSANNATIATDLQADIRAVTGFDAVEIGVVTVASADRLVVRIPVSNLAAFSTGFTGASADELGLDADNAIVYEGLDAENIEDALDRMESLNAGWYWLALSESIEDDSVDALAAASWVASQLKMLIYSSRDAGALDSNETGSTIAMLRALNYSRTAALWSATADYKNLALAAIFSSVDFEGSATQITAAFKQLKGVKADDITRTQQLELERKRCNHYLTHRGTAIILQGYTLGAGTQWMDAQYFIDWLTNEIQLDVFDLQVSSGKLPNTADGVAAIKDVMITACNQGVQSGGIAPNDVSPAIAAEIRQRTGNPSFDGTLNNGFLVYNGALSELSQTKRDARETVPFYAWVKLSGAIQSVDAAISFLN